MFPKLLSEERDKSWSFLQVTTRQKVTTIQKQFFQYCRFPGDAVDGTHVYIRSPGGARARYYFNRKNRYSIDVQVRINEYIMTGSSTAFPLDPFFVGCKIFTLDIYTLQSCVLYIHANSLVNQCKISSGQMDIKVIFPYWYSFHCL